MSNNEVKILNPQYIHDYTTKRDNELQRKINTHKTYGAIFAILGALSTASTILALNTETTTTGERVTMATIALLALIGSGINFHKIPKIKQARERLHITMNSAQRCLEDMIAAQQQKQK